MNNIYLKQKSFLEQYLVLEQQLEKD